MSAPSTTTAERAAAIGFPFDHVDLVCPGDHDSAHCMFCDGGLFACTACGSFEGATTTQCPGEPFAHSNMTDAIYAGRLDYRHGQWIAGASVYCPGGFSQLLTDAERDSIEIANRRSEELAAQAAASRVDLRPMWEVRVQKVRPDHEAHQYITARGNTQSEALEHAARILRESENGR